MRSEKWGQEEIAVLERLVPYMTKTPIAEIISKHFSTNRTPSGIRHKALELQLEYIKTDLDKAAESVSSISEAIAKDVMHIGKIEQTPDFTPETNFEDMGNIAVLSKKGYSIPKTLDALLDKCSVDRKIWEVSSHKVNVWESPVKGSDDKRELYQIKANLVRKIPVKSKWPVVQPVTAGKFTRPKYAKKESGIETAVVLSDLHVGYMRDMRTGELVPMHSRVAIDIVCQVIEEIRPDVVVVAGDIFDNAEFSSKFIQMPEFAQTTQRAIIETHWILKRIASACGKWDVKLELGNHDERLLLSIINNLRAAYDIRPANEPDGPPALSIESLLDLKGLGIEFCGDYKSGEYWINDNIRVSHGAIARAKSGQTSAAIVQDARCSELFGHIHRIESATKTVWGADGPKTYMAASYGCLANLDPGVLPAVKHKNNMQNGFGVVQYEPGNGYFNSNAVQIIGNKCIYNGKVWIGIDNKKQIESDTGWKL